MPPLQYGDRDGGASTPGNQYAQVTCGRRTEETRQGVFARGSASIVLLVDGYDGEGVPLAHSLRCAPLTNSRPRSLRLLYRLV